MYSNEPEGTERAKSEYVEDDSDKDDDPRLAFRPIGSPKPVYTGEPVIAVFNALVGTYPTPAESGQDGAKDTSDTTSKADETKQESRWSGQLRKRIRLSPSAASQPSASTENIEATIVKPRDSSPERLGEIIEKAPKLKFKLKIPERMR